MRPPITSRTESLYDSNGARGMWQSRSARPVSPAGVPAQQIASRPDPGSASAAQCANH